MGTPGRSRSATRARRGGARGAPALTGWQVRIASWMTERMRHRIFLLSRPMTLGVRALVEDDAQRLLLVRHSYKSGWHLPGGGVEPDETVRAALDRELREEVGLRPAGAVTLVGLYANQAVSRRDHVALFRVRAVAPCEPDLSDREIAERRWVSRSDLPEACEPGVGRRVAEIFGGRPVQATW